MGFRQAVPLLVCAAACSASGQIVLESPGMPWMPWRPLELPAGLPPAGAGYIQVNRNADGLNIPGDAANEPSIAVDPLAPNRITIGWRQFDTIQSNFRQAGFSHSYDGGRTWTPGDVYDRGVFRTDPVLRCNAEGRMFFNSLDGGFNTQMIIADRPGAPLPYPPVNCPGGDKLWMAIDTRPAGSLGRGNIYMAWNTAGNNFAPATFTRSTDNGLTYSTPQTLPAETVFGTLAVGIQGELYIFGTPNSTSTSTFRVIRSLNARDPAVTPTFLPAVTVNMGGSALFATGPNPAGLLGQHWIAVDHSTGPRRGWVYVLSSVDPPGADPMDIKLCRSSDGGATWSPPIRVNSEAAVARSWQWFGTLSIAPNGRVDVVYNSTAELLNTSISRTMYTGSADGGDTWTTPLAITPVWNSHVGWPQQNKIGDYYDMHSDLLGADLAFATTLNGEQDVYFARIGPRDCNGNGIDDEADFVSFTARDCNNNGIADSCEIAARTELDADGDGSIDSCQACPADFNADGNRDPDDLSDFITCFFLDAQFPGTCPRADFNNNAARNPDDLADFITAFFTGC